MKKIHSIPIQVKICGFTRAQDALDAANLGVDAIGLVFFAGSKRFVSIEQAQEIVRVLPPMVNVVGLFVNESAQTIDGILKNVPLHTLQFHGDETPEFCRQFQRPYWKAIRVQNTQDIVLAMEKYHDAQAILLDASVAGQFGGTGHCFDWKMIPPDLPKNWILSGGLNPENIRQAIELTGTKCVDVSSGVESSAGIKSPEKMAALIQACHL